MAGSNLVCVNVPAFPIQILQRETGVSREVPLVVVADTRPTARVVACNDAATAHGVRPGMAYSQALALSATVRAGVVSPEMKRHATDAITTILQRFSPTVEASDLAPGAFWLDIRGVLSLFGGDGPWLRQVRAAVSSAGWEVRVCRGWSRPGTLLAVRHAAGPTAFSSPDTERAWLRRQSLELLPLHARDRDRLRMVALLQVGRFLDVPAEALTRRFSADTMHLHRFLSDHGAAVPVQGTLPEEPLHREFRFEPPVTSTAPVRRAVERLIEELTGRLRRDGRWIDALEVGLEFERAAPHRERINCGRATRDAAYLCRLLALRFERLHIGRRFVRLVTIDGEVSTGELRQEEFAFGMEAGESPAARYTPRSGADDGTRGGVGDRVGDPGPEPALLDRTIATLQAEFGTDAVGTYAVVPGRFPEERFALQPLRHGRALVPRDLPRGDGGPLVRIRRVIVAGGDPTPRHGPTPAVGGSPDRSVPVFGPFLVSSAWWDGTRTLRRYVYRRSGGGGIEWGYYCGDRYVLQGYLS